MLFDGTVMQQKLRSGILGVGWKFLNCVLVADQARKALVARVKKEIKEREQHLEAAIRPDLLSRLLKEDSRLPEEVIVDFILFLAHAGHHTSSRVMVFAVKHLTEDPAALQKLRVSTPSRSTVGRKLPLMDR